MSKEKSLETRIKKAASNGIITCAALRKIAEEVNATYGDAGKAADNLKIKVRNCDLGCF
jgi:LAO/AO transport system kinase